MRANSVTRVIWSLSSGELPWLHGRRKSLREPEPSSRRLGFSGVRGGGCPWVAAASFFPRRSYLIFLSSMESSSSFNHGSLLEESSGSCNLETTGGSSSLHSLFPSTSGSFWALEEDAAGGSFSLPDLSKASGQMPLLISAPTSTSPMMTKPAAQ